MKIILTGGGTGGHVYPALSIANELKRRDPLVEIIFVGTERGIESRLVPEAKYPLIKIKAAGLNRKQPLKNFGLVAVLAESFHQCGRIIEDFKPDLVIGTGGYVSGPLVFMASMKGIKTCIHEQNAYPGLTNRMLGLTVSKILTGFQASNRYFIRKKRTFYTGNPVRREFYSMNREGAREKLGLSKDAFQVLSFGGSGGAGILNEIMRDCGEILKDRDIWFTHVTGERYFESFAESMDLDIRMDVHPYIRDMAEQMASADLIVSRAGAITVAEILKLGKASILVPSPNVTGNHQYYNAAALVESGCALMMEEKGMSGRSMAEMILNLYENPDILKKMEQRAEAYQTLDATKLIVDKLTNW